MVRLKDDFLDQILSIVPLQDVNVLDIGCGDGSRTIRIAQRCGHVTGVDIDTEKIRQAQKTGISNAEFFHLNSDKLPFRASSFDVAIFTLSFHHINPDKMEGAINEAIRVTNPEGHIIFLEPSTEGSFFEAEIRFGACDGDERKKKALAYTTMTNHQGLRSVAELYGETHFAFDSLEDFLETMQPKSTDREAMFDFINHYDGVLTARRRLNIFSIT